MKSVRCTNTIHGVTDLGNHGAVNFIFCAVTVKGENGILFSQLMI